MMRLLSARVRSRTGVVVSALAVGSLLLGGCSSDTAMQGRIDALQKRITQLKADGATRCAPRELAMAESHTGFAQIGFHQGFMSKVRGDLAVAELNADAADKQTLVQYCTDRGMVAPEPKVGDRDGDGYLDDVDKCPNDPENYNGFQDEDGCPDDPDTDGDGIKDSVDQCPLIPEDMDKYLDEDGCPEPDNDLDGIPDEADKCPNDPEDPDGFEDTDGCPDLDNDKDTVPDLEDMCPNEPGDPNGTPKGCPKQSLVVVTDNEIKITEQIHFEFDKAVIRKESFKILDAVAEVLQKFPNMKLEIQGHTDNRGKPAYNKKLSQKRADAVRTYLIKKKGIDPDRLTAVGYGMEKPLVDNDTDLHRAMNRRVQFIRMEKNR